MVLMLSGFTKLQADITEEQLAVIKKDIADTYQNMIISLQQQSFIDQFQALAAAGIKEITPKQIATISPSVIPAIFNEYVQQFNQSQIAALTIDQIKAFLPSQVRALTPSQLTNLSETQIAALEQRHFQGMTVNQINVIVKKMAKLQIQYLLPEHIMILSIGTLIDRMEDFSQDQVEQLTSAQIVDLKDKIAPQIGNLLPKQFAILTDAQLQLMTIEQITKQLPFLTAKQIGALVAVQVSKITADQINLMTIVQLKALKALLEDATKITTANNPNVINQIALVTQAIDDADLTCGEINAIKDKPLTSTMYVNLTPEQVKCLSATHIKNLKNDQLTPLVITNLKTEQAAHLRKDQIASLPINLLVTLLAKFAKEQFAYITPSQLIAIPTDTITNAISESNLRALKGALEAINTKASLDQLPKNAADLIKALLEKLEKTIPKHARRGLEKSNANAEEFFKHGTVDQDTKDFFNKGKVGKDTKKFFKKGKVRI
jgi:hypothetical protein